MPSAPRVTEFPVGGKSATRLPWLGLGLLLSAAGTGFYFSHDSQFLVGEIASMILGVFGLHGLVRGGFRKLVMLPLTIGSLFLISAKPDFADPVVTAIAGHPSILGNMMACGLAMVVTFLATGALVKYVRNKVIVRQPMLLGADRFVGTTVGLAEGALLMLVMCWTAVITQPQMTRLRDNPGTAPGTGRYAVANSMLEIVREIDNSPLRTLVRDHNLLKDVPVVKSMIDQLEKAAANGDFWNGSPSDFLKNVDPVQFGELGNAVKQLQAENEKRSAAYQRAPAPSR